MAVAAVNKREIWDSGGMAASVGVERIERHTLFGRGSVPSRARQKWRLSHLSRRGDGIPKMRFCEQDKPGVVLAPDMCRSFGLN